MTKQQQQQALATRIREYQEQFAQIGDAAQAAAIAGEMAGPFGSLLDAETLAVLRFATEIELNASIAAASGLDPVPVGTIVVDGREVFVVPSWLLAVDAAANP